MKKLLSIIAIAAVMASCNDSKKEETPVTPADSITTDATTTSTMAADSMAKAAAIDTANKMVDTAHSKMTNAMDTASKAVDKAADKMDKAVDKAADKMNKAVDKAADKMKEKKP